MCLPDLSPQIIQQGQMSVRLDGEQYVVRHAECAGFTTGPNGCSLCQDLLTEAVASEVSKWSYRIDLAGYATSLAYGSPEDVRMQAELILSRDYRHAGFDFAALQDLPDKRRIIFTIRHLVWFIYVDL